MKTWIAFRARRGRIASAVFNAPRQRRPTESSLDFHRRACVPAAAGSADYFVLFVLPIVFFSLTDPAISVTLEKMPGYHGLLLGLLAIVGARAEPPANGVSPSNVLGGLEQHASFSFVRPGLTQTAFAFNGPSSHQAFSSSVGDPHLAQRVLPSVANALAYRNPGLGYSPVAPITTAYGAGPPQSAAPTVNYQQQQYDYQQQQALALAYQQQLQQYQQQLQQQQQIYPGYSQQVQAEPIDAAGQQNIEQQAHLARLVASRFAGTQAQPVASDAEQIQQQQQVQQQHANLLGVAYSAAPSVAHVKVNGNGYKFDF